MPEDDIPLPDPRCPPAVVAWSEWVVAAVEIAASQHPEMLRAALGSVFDLSAVKAQVDFMRRNMESHYEAAVEVRALLEAVGRMAAEFERRLHEIDYAIDQLTAGNVALAVQLACEARGVQLLVTHEGKLIGRGRGKVDGELRRLISMYKAQVISLVERHRGRLPKPAPVNGTAQPVRK